MRVLFVNAVCGSGSTGRICTDIADALRELGHEARILYGNGMSAYPNAVRVGSDFSVKLNALYARVSGYTAHGAIPETKRIIQEILTFRPDVVHLHNLHANYVHLTQLLAFLAEKDIPTVITLHDCWFFTGKCSHYHSVGCTKWQTGCGNCEKLKDDIPSFFFDKTQAMWLEKRDGFSKIKRLGVIGVSNWITDEAKKSFLADAAIVRRIYNWIDLKTFVPRNVQNPDEKAFTIFCASASWNRNTDRFRDLQSLAAQLDPSMELVVAGDVECPEQLPPNVTCIGYLNSQEVLASAYASADVYVHLSREDTFGKVIAEALACGTPAVVYDSTACPEIVTPGTGYVVPVGDIEGILNCCRLIKENGKDIYTRLCRASTENRFDKEKLIAETFALYAEVTETIA
ncbi:MAG: glycosyltransferase [Clostridiales bacterium]|nr:glycosyltransferase [Clostridiales bacterium]